jgi:putative membrane protein
MKKYYVLTGLFITGVVISGIHPRNYVHWAGEMAAPLIGFTILVLTFKRFRYTSFTYWAILISCFMMFIGAHYTFSRVPLFDWIRDYFGLARNNFDKAGHFLQGIIPVLIVREIFIRRKLVDRAWIGFISFCISMAVTSVYEVIEYLVCAIAKGNPNTFLGTQGDIWDSQSDMLAAAIGALFVLFLLTRIHDRVIMREFPSGSETKPLAG